MGASDWRVIYRGYSAEKLATEMEKLEAGLSGGFTAQSSGSVNHQRDVTELRDRLRAAADVKAERSGNAPGRVATVDFSGTGRGDF